MSIRGSDWIEFSAKVYDHIDHYTVPQYGDKVDDLASGYTPNEFIMQMNKYIKRHGKNSRPGQDKLDLIKIAHYAQMCYTLLEEQENVQK